MNLFHINAKISAMKATLLPFSFFDQLYTASSLSAIFELLRNTPYDKYLDPSFAPQEAIENALERRMIHSLISVRKLLDSNLRYLFDRFVSQYEVKYIKLLLDQKLRNVENPTIYSILDDPKKLLKAYKTKSLAGLFTSTTIGQELSAMSITKLPKFICDIIGKETLSYSMMLDYYVILCKKELTSLPIIGKIIERELKGRAYLLGIYLEQWSTVEKIFGFKKEEVEKEAKKLDLEGLDPYKGEFMLEERILQEYSSNWVVSNLHIDRIFIFFKMLELEKFLIMKAAVERARK